MPRPRLEPTRQDVWTVLVTFESGRTWSGTAVSIPDLSVQVAAARADYHADGDITEVVAR